LVVAKGSEILLHHLWLPLGLTVCPHVDSCRELVIHTEVEANSVPKLTGKHLSAIGGEIVQYTAFADYVFENHSCPLWGVNILPAGDVSIHSGQTVDNYQDSGVSQCHRIWQVGNEVHDQSLPGTSGRSQWNVELIACVMWSFDSVAELTANIILPYF
jgi:hypothetical protein